MNITRQRLLTRGDLPHSDGGIYNPGAWIGKDDCVHTLLRVESDYLFTAQGLTARALSLNIRTTDAYGTNHQRIGMRAFNGTRIAVEGFAPETRFEDLRPFFFQDQLHVAGVRWKPSERWTFPIKPVLATWDDPSGMALADEWVLPIPYQPIEKNWVLLDKDGELYTVYSLSPLVIFRRTHLGEWAPFRSDPNDWQATEGTFLKNSTHLLPFRGGYLGWWHILRERAYFTGAYWLDADLQLKARTPAVFDGREIVWAPDIYKPGVLYISSQVLVGEDVLLFYGEGDSHSGVATLKQSDLADALGL